MKTKLSLSIPLVLVISVFSTVSFSQDIHFSQFYMSPLTQNPSMAGALYDMQALINYKNQWQSVASPYKTVAASYDLKLNKKKAKKGYWAAGLNFFSDKAGDAKMGQVQANLSLAYHLLLNEYNTLGAGLQGGYAQMSVDYAAFQWGSQYNGNVYDPGMSTGETAGSSSFGYADMAAGLLWTYNNTAGAKNVTDNHDLKANLGFSVFHVTQPNYVFYDAKEKLNMKYVAHGNALISIPNSNIAFVPGITFNQQGSSRELYAGSLIRYKLQQDSKYTGLKKGAAFSIGAFLRAKDAVAATMLLEYSQYAIGFSYDLNTSRLKSASEGRGGFEISIRFVNPNPFLYSHSQARFN